MSCSRIEHQRLEQKVKQHNPAWTQSWGCMSSTIHSWGSTMSRITCANNAASSSPQKGAVLCPNAILGFHGSVDAITAKIHCAHFSNLLHACAVGTKFHLRIALCLQQQRPWQKGRSCSSKGRRLEQQALQYFPLDCLIVLRQTLTPNQADMNRYGEN